MEKPQHPRNAVCLYTQLHRAAGLLHRDYYMKRRGDCTQLNKEKQSSGRTHGSRGRESLGGHWLHTLSLFSPGPKEGFATPPSLTWGRLWHSREAKAFGSLTWPWPSGVRALTEGSTCSLQCGGSDESPSNQPTQTLPS